MPDPTAVAKIRSAIGTAFDRIGRDKFTSCPTQNNTDPLLHEFYVAAELNSMAKKRYDAAKDKILDDEETGLGIEAAAARVNEGSSGTLLLGDAYNLNLRINNGSHEYPHADFVSALRREGVSAEVIAKAEARAKRKRAGAKNYSVSPNL